MRRPTGFPLSLTTFLKDCRRYDEIIADTIRRTIVEFADGNYTFPLLDYALLGVT